MCAPCECSLVESPFAFAFVFCASDLCFLFDQGLGILLGGAGGGGGEWVLPASLPTYIHPPPLEDLNCFAHAQQPKKCSCSVFLYFCFVFALVSFACLKYLLFTITFLIYPCVIFSAPQQVLFRTESSTECLLLQPPPPMWTPSIFNLVILVLLVILPVPLQLRLLRLQQPPPLWTHSIFNMVVMLVLVILPVPVPLRLLLLQHPPPLWTHSIFNMVVMLVLVITLVPLPLRPLLLQPPAPMWTQSIFNMLVMLFLVILLVLLPLRMLLTRVTARQRCIFLPP